VAKAVRWNQFQPGFEQNKITHKIVQYKYYAETTCSHYAYPVRAAQEQAERCASAAQYRPGA